MVVTKTGSFSVASPPGTVTPTTVRNAIVSVYASFGVSPFAQGLIGGNPAVVFALQFSAATRGTVYQQIVCSGTSTITITQTVFTLYDAGSLTGTGGGPSQNFQIASSQVERTLFAYVRPDEIYCLATRTPGAANSYLGVVSPFTRPTWWNEDLFAHVFSFSANGGGDFPDFRGLYRGLSPDFFNPFPNTISSSADNVTCTMGDLIGWNQNPVRLYDVISQPMLRWSGLQNYGWVGRFSLDIGVTTSLSLQAEQVITLDETEAYEVLTTANRRSFLLRVV